MTDDCGFQDTFGALSDDAWHVADYDFDHPHFATDWRSTNARPGSDGLRLALIPSPGGERFQGGSVRRLAPTHYGRYAARLRAGAGSGVVTGVFLYSGPAYGTPHWEIDLELLGAHPQHAHLAIHAGGRRYERRVALPFDATKQIALYEINWEADAITWTASDTVLHSLSDEDFYIPAIPLRLFLNVWAAAPTLSTWAGRIRAGHRAEALVRAVSFQPH
ncbi:MAG: family 16 glycosylhydrolase [Shimia sp.]